MPGPRVLPLAFAVALVLGCTGTAETIPVIPPSTSIWTDPNDFLGSVSCIDAPGGLRSYTATLTDVTPTDGGVPFTLPSSPPTSCSLEMSFQYVIPNHVYSAQIDGYEEPADALLPYGPPNAGAAAIWTGARQMVLASTGAPVTPRWTTSCGEDPGAGTTALFEQYVFMRSCAPLQDHGASSTGVSVDFATALGDLTCAKVASLDVTPENPALPAQTGVPCGAGSVSFLANIQAGQTYAFAVKGHAKAGGPVTLGGRCSALATPSVIVPASCDELTSTGAASFDVTPLLAQKGVACAPGVSFSVALTDSAAAPDAGPVGPPVGSPSVPCGQTVQLGPLAAGPHAATLTVTMAPSPGSAGATAILNALCTAQVTPGDTVPAACTVASP